MSYKGYEVLGYGLGLGVMFFLVLALFVPFWALWNWIMPLFGLPTLTILQSVGLFFLLKLVIFTPNTKE